MRFLFRHTKAWRALPLVLIPLLALLAGVGSADAMVCRSEAGSSIEILESYPITLALLSSQLPLNASIYDSPTPPIQDDPVRTCTDFDGDDCTLSIPLGDPTQPNRREFRRSQLLLPNTVSQLLTVASQMAIAMCDPGQPHPGYGRKLYRPPQALCSS